MVYPVISREKAEVRAAILAARRAMTPQQRDHEATAIEAHLPDLVGLGDTVCAYVPMGTEPGSIDLVDNLLRLGARVLLPVAPSEAAPLQWGEYRPGELVDARFGLKEPPPPRLPAEAIADARVVLVPALAVDRTGARLGRGAGYYDRSLPLADPAARLIAVVRDEELVERLPAEPHDVRMTHALTPSGVVALSS
ncbi:5-formyltetrahydrofolate cyclo-ligase [Mycobacterium hubeiense]|uniref:5-formyltetrahydrofolate cyclo-ligase n=1 Tax=Mycobacterium hubeiense TaxID=1867256 RepID=UPI000C7F31B5|nr:5-formyltetrahydrofolate cyclo-ligase [Mycobacterium sp. QGD 101]